MVCHGSKKGGPWPASPDLPPLEWDARGRRGSGGRKSNVALQRGTDGWRFLWRFSPGLPPLAKNDMTA